MARQTERFALSHCTPGTNREVILHRYGEKGSGKLAYLQASIHADETPAMIALHHLTILLDEAEAAGKITGEIRLVPYANPIGLSQFIRGHHMGRYDLRSGNNFNRGWPDLSEGLADKLAGALGNDEAANVSTIRNALKEQVAAMQADSELGSLQKILAGLAVDADYVFDLHCDSEALMHIYLLPSHWPLAAGLAAELGCRGILLAEDSGGGPFDECFSTPWTKLQARFPELPIPAACFGTTIELRGQSDVSDDLAAQDAKALFRTLQREGLIEGDPGPIPEAQCEATDLTACQVVKAPAAGILAYAAELGDQIKKGQTIAWIIDPAAASPKEGRQAVASQAEGLLLTRSERKYVAANEGIAKIVGKEALSTRQMGSLLEA